MLRFAWRAVRRAYASPAKAGSVVFVACVVLFPGPIGNAGVSAEQLSAVPHFTAMATAVLVALFIGHVVLGFALGGVAHLGLRSWDAARGRNPPWSRQYLRVVGAVGAFELWRIAVTVVHYPQVVAPWLHDRGGGRRAFQVALTEHVPRAALEGSGWIALAAFFLGPLALARGRALVRAWLARNRREAAFLAALGAIALSGLGGASARSPGARGARQPSFLVLGVDSLRTDHSPSRRPDLWPHFRALCERGVTFDAAHVSLPRTYPSLVTFLTGRWPAHHGIRHSFPTREARERAGVALPHVLRKRGYGTAVVAYGGPTSLTALDLGFANLTRLRGNDIAFEMQGAVLDRQLAMLPWTTLLSVRRRLPALREDWSCSDPFDVSEDVLAAVDEASANGPFFVLGFYSTTHMPYAAPDPYYRLAADPAYPGDDRYECFCYKRAGAWPPAESQHARALYDGSVAATDAAIGQLLEGLAARGLDRDTIVVLFADHGENLGELDHGFGHGDHLRGDDALGVPLVIADPRGQFPPHAVRAIVRDVDLAPTLAALGGATLPGADGRDLTPLLTGAAASLDLDAFAETEVAFGPFEGLPEALPFPRFPDYLIVEGGIEAAMDPKWEDLVLAGKHRALTTDRWKLHYEPRRSGPVWRLHDRVRDPDEREDMQAREPEVFRALRARLLEWMAADGSREDERGFVVRPGVVPGR